MDDFILAVEPEENGLESLPDLEFPWSPFSVPRLEEKPQNPIIDTLKLNRKKAVTHGTPYNGQQAAFPIQEEEDELHSDKLLAAVPISTEDIWEQAISSQSPALNIAASWDTVNGPYVLPAPSSSYLSQQTPRVLSAAQRLLGDCDQDITAVTSNELLLCIDGMLRGISTVLYVWDPEAQTFHPRDTACSSTSRLVLSGMSLATTESLMRRFITIGSLVRRLEALVTDVWQTSSQAGPAVHSFTHAVSSILEHLKPTIANISQSALRGSDSDKMGPQALARLWSECSTIEEQLEVVADLCGCGMDNYSQTRDLVSQSATQILSRVYQRLDTHLGSEHSADISASLAFILSVTSADYFDQVCRRVGYSGNDDRDLAAISQKNLSMLFDDFDESQAEEPPIPEYEDDGDVPCFFQDSFARALSNAKKSLKLLRIAHPNHPILDSAGSRRDPIRWFWSTADVTKAWLGPEVEPIESDSPDPYSRTSRSQSADPDDMRYPVDFLDFKRFDLEPGDEVYAANPTEPHSRIPQFTEFLASFPDTLPSLTPSLSDLTDLVLAPLATHVDSLSTALLDTFLAPSSGYLKFSTHLVLLRSFLLLASPSLKGHLEGSLFSNYVGDSDLGIVPPRGSMKKIMNAGSAWVIGLAPGLMAGGWPPAGADLSFLLRTVIFDALDHEYPGRQLRDHRSTSDNQADEGAIYDEAEWRLGFAIRDLPTGSGQAKWLNPRSIEALDFLYMNYQPPPALEVLISQDTLSKYHRLFVFNIRLLRVENVVKALFRMTSPGSDPLFQTITPSQKLFEHLRFVASSFVQTLSSYVYDVAIGSNFDAFLFKLDRSDGVDSDGEPHTFRDVFSLAEAHSKLMDDVLSACLMRSSQKPVGDLLRSILDIVLEFGILMSDLHQSRIQEYQAVGPLEDLYASFRKKMIVLVKVLRSLVDKGTMSTKMSFEDMRLQILTGHNLRGVGVTANLFDLLVRLDVAQWWTRQGRK